MFNKVGAAHGVGDQHDKDAGRRGTPDTVGTVLTILSLIFILATFPLTAWICVKVVMEYERVVILRMGRVLKGHAKGPGVLFVIPWLDILHRVDLRTAHFKLPLQLVLTADGVPLRVNAVVFYRVVEPSLWVTRVANGAGATRMLAQSTLRASLGARTLADILAQRRGIACGMEEVLSARSRGWGVEVERVELKAMRLPHDLQRCMAAEAEVSREARAKLILAEGEVKAARVLSAASAGLSPVAMQLRYLLCLPSIVSEASSTVVFPWPTELLQPRV